MERIRSRIFSVEEANRLIPYLEESLESLSAMSREVASLRREVEVLGAIESSGATGKNRDVRELREKESRCSQALERLRESMQEISAHGCIIRDLDLGLVDFYTMARDRVVCLCWRRGEARVEHWHPVDEGFSGRRPLAELP